MGNVFGSEKPLKEIIRENQRMLKKAMRELEREIGNLRKNETKLVNDIKKMAKEGQMSSVKIMAKDLVRTRNYVTRFIEMKTHLNAVSLKMQTVKSTQAMSDAMKGVTKAMVSMNKKLDLPGMQKIMAEFMKENEMSEMRQEMIGDTLDDAFAEDGSVENEEAIVSQVLDELNINVAESVPEAPTEQAKAATANASGAEEAKVAEGADSEISELQERLNNLRR